MAGSFPELLVAGLESTSFFSYQTNRCLRWSLLCALYQQIHHRDFSPESSGPTSKFAGGIRTSNPRTQRTERSIENFALCGLKPSIDAKDSPRLLGTLGDIGAIHYKSLDRDYVGEIEECASRTVTWTSVSRGEKKRKKTRGWRVREVTQARHARATSAALISRCGCADFS